MKLAQSLLVCSALLFSACNLEPLDPVKMPTDAEVEQYNASVPPEERIVCRRERVVSSTIPRRVCRRVNDLQSETIFTRDELRRVLR